MAMFSPKYQITDEISCYLSDIAEVKSLVDHAKLLPSREFTLRRTTSIKLAHSSTSIEGNSLEEYQIKKLLDGDKVIAQKDEIREVQNYFRALHLVDRYAKKSEITVSNILNFHKTVIDGLVEESKVGVFRPGPIYITNQAQVVYTGPNSKKVKMLVEELVSWLSISHDIHPVIRAGLLHYQFVTIHPFSDGNGRSARLLTLLHLYQSGWDFRKSLALDEFYNTNRLNYYQSLQTGESYKSRQSVDLTDWLTYFTRGFWESALKLKEQVLSLQVGGGDIAARHLNSDELKIIDFVLTLGKVTSEDVVDILGVPKRTAQSKLNRLESYLILEKIGSGPSTYYALAKI
jgi:Fic family protein